MKEQAGASNVRVAVEDGIGVLTLNDPATRNALGLETADRLGEAIEGLIADSQVRAIILTGAGGAFCSGANLSGGADKVAVYPSGPSRGLIDHHNPLIDRLRRSPKPTVAAIDGIAAGLGASLALACDLAVAGEGACFLFAFRRVGLVPDAGATWLLPRAIGKARAMELLLLGNRLPAATAAEWGLINRCVPDGEVMRTAKEFARALADGPASLAMIRQLVWSGLDTGWQRQLDAEAHAQGDAARTADSREGIAAFVEKRSPQFRGL